MPRKSQNSNGVDCYAFTTGGHFMGIVGYDDNNDPIYKTFAPVDVPACCVDCRWFEIDHGEFSEQLSPPYCQINIWFPTKKGTCKKRELLHDPRKE